MHVKIDEQPKRCITRAAIAHQLREVYLRHTFDRLKFKNDDRINHQIQPKAVD